LPDFRGQRALKLSVCRPEEEIFGFSLLWGLSGRKEKKGPSTKEPGLRPTEGREGTFWISRSLRLLAREVKEKKPSPKEWGRRPGRGGNSAPRETNRVRGGGKPWIG